MANQIEKYGMLWDASLLPIQIEFTCIRMGGKWKRKDGSEGGMGLSYHYEQCRKILWPRLDDHRWHRLIRDTIIENKCTILAGPASSGKTHEAAWVFLLEYMIYPDETCVLVSSTDSRGLRGRIWSEITMLWQEARDQYEWLPGNLLDSRLSILTDALDEDEFDRKARNYRKCIQGVPCRESASSGLLRYAGWKQKRMRLVADEAGQMAPEFINGITNLNSNPNFKCVILGNFKDPLDCLGKCAEPVDGWGKHMAPLKTEVWDTFFPLKGKCVNLIGFDSPNFDFQKKDPNDPDKFSYMIGPKRIAEIEASFGRDSEQFMSQCWGSMKVSTIVNRVLTREICEKTNCFEDVVWEGSPTIKVVGLDASWGGDRCPLTVGEFGKDVRGKIVLRVHAPVIVPVLRRPDQDADYAIAEFCKSFCEQQGIPPENFYHDSTGRGSLGTALARVWSAQCNPIEFGGVPSKRPVTLDYYWNDPKTGQRRLKLACEHYSKFVTELWFSVRYCAEAGQLKNLPREVFEEFAMRIWSKVSGDRYEIESKSGTTDKPGMKQRTGRSPDLADSLCWVGSTLILTPNGEVRIDSLRPGDEVITPFGITKIYMVHESPEMKLTRVVFSNGRTLEGRGRHKVFTWDSGWVYLDSLSIDNDIESCDNLPLWNILSALFTKDGPTAFKQLVDIIKTRIGAVSRRDFYIESSGASTTGLFARAIVSIIKTASGGIIESKIWNWLRNTLTPATIVLRIGEIQRPEKNLWTVFLRGFWRRQSGIGLMLEENGILKIHCELGRLEREKRSPLNASSAAKGGSLIFPMSQNNAQQGAETNGRLQRLLAIIVNVLFVVRSLLLTSTGQRKVAPVTVRQLLPQESKRVYNLTLEEHNVYYANGILVENCIAVEGARRRGFQISKLANESESSNSLDWFRDLQRKSADTREKHALNFQA